MTRRLEPRIVARNLRQLADLLDDTGPRAIRQAALLSARGWPSSTNGNGSRSSDQTSSTERAAVHGAPATKDGKWNPGPFDNLDARLARQLELLDSASRLAFATINTVLAQANDDDPVPAGTGTCLRCDKLVRPDGKRPHNRIQSGYCPACYRKWVRLGRPDRSTFTRTADEQDVA